MAQSSSGEGNGFREQFREARDSLDPILEAQLGRGTQSLSEAEWETLRTVAKDSESRGASFREFAFELVKVFLTNRLPANAVNTDVLDRMSQTVGETLMGDHASRQKLAEFQQQLLGK